jgi:hypothetical protein
VISRGVQFKWKNFCSSQIGTSFIVINLSKVGVYSGDSLFVESECFESVKNFEGSFRKAALTGRT